MLSPFALGQLSELLSLPGHVWWLVAASGAFLAIYYGALGHSYQLGDLTITYPLARSSPILVVMVTTLILGRGEQVGWGCIAGSVLIVAGCVLVPLERISQISWRSYICASCSLAFVAACGTAGYSILDDEALRRIRDLHPQVQGIEQARLALLYAALQTVPCALFLGVIVLGPRKQRRQLAHVWRNVRWQACGAGVSIVVTYSLVLYAMGFIENVSYVVAFRQLSIPIGVALGAMLLGERVKPVRWLGVAVLLVGLTLVAFG